MRSRPSTTSSPTRARLNRLLFVYFLGVVAVLTLTPFHFVMPTAVDVAFTGDWFDIAANVLMFVPLGFLYPLTRATGEDPSPASAFAWGLLLSAVIESVQLFEPARVSSAIDVLTNAAGAALGALLVREVVRRIRVNAKLVGRLSLEIPLIGLIYLIVPLLVVVSFAALEQPPQLVLLVPLGLIGVRLMAAVQRNHFAKVGLLNNRAMGMIAGGWMILGIFPVLPRFPLIGSALVVGVGVLTWLDSSLVRVHESTDRRFEMHALRGAAPFLVAYLLGLMLLPFIAGTGHWRFHLGFAGPGSNITIQQLRLLESVATLTVVGYLLAEARGRRELPFRTMAVRVFLECGCVSAALEGIRGYQRTGGASGIQWVLLAVAGTLGAGIYHSQREHVHWILANRAEGVS